jgi:hypothetical protein
VTNPRATPFIFDPDTTLGTLEIRGEVEIRPDPEKAEAERVAPTYGHAPSVWDPDGTTRTVLVLRPRRIVTLG